MMNYQTLFQSLIIARIYVESSGLQKHSIWTKLPQSANSKASTRCVYTFTAKSTLHCQNACDASSSGCGAFCVRRHASQTLCDIISVATNPLGCGTFDNHSDKRCYGMLSFISSIIYTCMYVSIPLTRIVML